MQDRIYTAGGFKGWAMAGLLLWLCVTPLALLDSYITNLSGWQRYPLEIIMFRSCFVAFFCALSALFNWGYERRFNEEIFNRFYAHPETLLERTICVFGGAAMIMVAPVLGFIVLMLLPALAFM